MIDADALVHERLTAAFPDWHVASEQDPEITFPAVIYSVSGEGQTGNGPGRWPLRLAVSVLAETGEVFAATSAVYEEVHAWRATSSEHGHVTVVADASLMSRITGANIGGRLIQQYAGAFDLIARA